jgi:hypothetical protein
MDYSSPASKPTGYGTPQDAIDPRLTALDEQGQSSNLPIYPWDSDPEEGLFVDQHGSSSYYPSSPVERPYSFGNAYGHNEGPSSSTRMSYGQMNQASGNGYGFGNNNHHNNQYENDPFQTGQTNQSSQFTRQDNQEENVDRDSDSERDSDDDAGHVTQVYEGLINNEGQYNDTKAHRLRAPSGARASDFPETEEEQKKLVRELFESIVDTSDVLDRPGKNGKPAQAVRRFQCGFYSSKLIELKCWEILVCFSSSLIFSLSTNKVI